MKLWSVVQFIKSWHQHYISPTQALKIFVKENLSENPGSIPSASASVLRRGEASKKAVKSFKAAGKTISDFKPKRKEKKTQAARKNTHTA